MINPYEWIKAILRTCDNSDGTIILQRNGIDIGGIKPKTNRYSTKKDCVHDLEWEDYPNSYMSDKDGKNIYVLWQGDLAIIFDDFRVEWI